VSDSASSTRTGVLHWVWQCALTAGALLGLASIALALATMFLGIQPLVFRSGSMEPAIRTGALALAREVPADLVRDGDVVSVRNDRGNRVTHRVVSITAIDSVPGGRQLTLKGDSNETVDQDVHLVTSVDRVIADVPYLGYVAAWISGPGGMFIAGLAIAGLIAYVMRRRTGVPPTAGRRKVVGTGTGTAAVVVGLTCAAFVGGEAPQDTLAAWNDTSTVTANTFQAHSVQRPSQLTCANGALTSGYATSVTIGITHTRLNYDYVLRVINSAGVQAGADILVSGTGAVGDTLSSTIARGSLNGGSATTATIRVYSRLNTATTWESASRAQWKIDISSASGRSVRCGGFTSPTAGLTTARSTLRSQLSTACGTGRPGCGPVPDTPGFVVAYQLKRVRNGATTYFHATSATNGSWTSDAAFENAALSGGTWSFDGSTTSAYADTGAYTLTIRAVDTAGNASTSTITFTLT
jgi:signal peptidase I